MPFTKKLLIEERAFLSIDILGKLFPSKAVRFLFFIYIEVNFLGMGCRAIGRFNNQALTELWKDGKLAPVFPGDRNYNR